MKILLTGGTGQVGFELQRSLAPLGRVIAPVRAELNLANLTQVASFLRHVEPDVIVNAAAWTAVDAAEEHPAQAQELNAELPEQLASYARKNGALLVHYSSDYVYAGDSEQPYSEEEACLPLSVYGRSKLDGDQAILDSCCRHLIFRTSWVYSERGRNFLNTMLRMGQTHDELEVVDDQVGAPTSARLIADTTALALTPLVSPRGSSLEQGIYHLAARGSTSWHGFAQAIFQHADSRGLRLRIRPERVRPISTTDYPTPAERPLNSRLDVSRLEKALGLQMPAWEKGLRAVLDNHPVFNGSPHGAPPPEQRHAT
ncbi:dTDP-4-dehydrorhamnose reductase [Billgrantia lactosivorans]|uniref:dTDP-4-dehydrorhamnose reductase n=1 Tax=Billgrantia lactosivorans TaxID=2185141 RepID=UPI000DAF0ED1|nr:dTDP-4-dehydrorhamnose reductase [Halomonas lactosivorans]